MKRFARPALGLCAAALLLAPTAHADSVAQLQIYKRLTAETIALIDPQGGTSMGGASTNVNYAVGDILTYRIAFTPVANGATRGLGGYITEYVPANTQVVGARMVDRNGVTVPPHRGGFGAIGWGPRGSEGYTLPLEEGGMSSLYADTGVFYSEDPRTARVPNNAFISVLNGILMNPSPTGAGQFDQLLGIQGNNYYAHNGWDWVQVQAFGVGGGALGNGTGNTPFKYGSAVAGPQTFYNFEATETSPGVIEATGQVGPWKRIVAPGAEIGTGVAATSAGTPDRLGVPTTLGFALSSANPLPTTTNAVRYALGELVVGDEYFAEISLRVLASPLDPIMNDDINCTEVFGGDASSKNPAGSSGGKDNTWRYFVPSPSCNKLDLRFELDVDKIMALPNDQLVYTLTTHNLSLMPRTNVVVTHDLSTTGAVSLISATGNPMIAGDVLTWPAITMQPGDLVVQTIVTDISGGGDTTTSTANYKSAELGDPAGFTVQTLSNIVAVTNLDLALTVTPNVTTAGSTVTYTATIDNVGTGTASNGATCEATVMLPAGFSYVTGTTMINGVAAANPTGTTNLCFATGVPSIPPGGTLTITFDASIAGGTAAGAYSSALETWFSTVEDAVFYTATVLVGLVPSDVPVVTGPLVGGETQVCGTTTEADGTTIVVYVDLLASGNGVASGGMWCVTVPALYSGQDVTATARNMGAAEVESAPSTSVEVLGAGGVSVCNDGLDNDLDGLTDFPADLGCSGAIDPDETNIPACSNGIDDDVPPDGLTDFPDDLSCSSLLDDDESGLPACSNGVDDDLDGAVDSPADPGCTGANDASEADVPQCANGLDDDLDGLADYPVDPGCDSASDDDEIDGATSGAGGAGGGASVSVGSGGGPVGPTGAGGQGTPPDPGGVPEPDGGDTGGEEGCDCRSAPAGDLNGLGVLMFGLGIASMVARRRRRSMQRTFRDRYRPR